MEWSASGPCRFTPENSRRYPLDVSLSRPQSRYGRYEGQGNLCPYWESNPGRDKIIRRLFFRRYFGDWTLCPSSGEKKGLCWGPYLPTPEVTRLVYVAIPTAVISFIN
jgi:hypothetical protein